MTIIEYSGVFFGLLCVYLTTKENIWCWPTGIISSVLLAFVFFDARLYSDMLENGIYVIMQLHGWWFWLYGRKLLKDQATVPIARLRVKQWIITATIILVGSAALGYSMTTYTDADFPYLDAFTTVMSLVAQYLLNKKILDNWVLWITVDVIGIWLYAAKGLYSISALYALFLVLATKGFFEWRRSRNTLERECTKKVVAA
jgi:nicotinamide mononucleotide transporter